MILLSFHNPLYSPGIRGWFWLDIAEKFMRGVFPVHTGMVLTVSKQATPDIDIPHAYGDDSYLKVGIDGKERYSPRIWGCFYLLLRVIIFIRKEILCPCYLYGFRILPEHEEILQQPSIRKACIPRFKKPHVQIEH